VQAKTQRLLCQRTFGKYDKSVLKTRRKKSIISLYFLAVFKMAVFEFHVPKIIKTAKDLKKLEEKRSVKRLQRINEKVTQRKKADAEKNLSSIEAYKKFDWKSYA
jgi:hypothetical protein